MIFGSKKKSNGSDPSNIGNILLQLGLLTEEQLKQIVQRAQEEQDKVFGQIAIEAGYINQADVDLALAKQAMMRGERTTGLATAIALGNAMHDRISSGIDEISELSKTITAQRAK